MQQACAQASSFPRNFLGNFLGNAPKPFPFLGNLLSAVWQKSPPVHKRSHARHGQRGTYAEAAGTHPGREGRERPSALLQDWQRPPDHQAVPPVDNARAGIAPAENGNGRPAGACEAGK